jgi:hypothetical protein
LNLGKAQITDELDKNRKPCKKYISCRLNRVREGNELVQPAAEG